MERVKLVYRSIEEEEVELPLRFLVLGDFSPHRLNPLSEEEITRIDIGNFDEILRNYQIHIHARIPNHLTQEKDTVIDLSLPIRSMTDFSPDSVIDHVPQLSTVVNLRKQLLAIRSSQQYEDVDMLTKEQMAFLNAFHIGDPPYSKEMINLTIATLSERINLQLDEILHCHEFTKMESLWRSLFHLVKQIPLTENCYVDLLNISKEKLLDDFENQNEITDSLLYQKVYLDELGQYGGKPYSVIIGDFEIHNSGEDLHFLQQCAAVAQLSYAPILMAASPQLMGCTTFNEVAEAKSLEEIFEKDIHYSAWRTLRNSAEAQYIGLTLPYVLLRQPYHFQKHQIEKFPYVESSDYLWGNATFALGACLIQSFINTRWYVDIIGPKGGKVPTDSWAKLEKDDPILPISNIFVEGVEDKLAQLGFIPLTYQKGDDLVAFYAANTIQASLIDHDDFEKNSLGDRLSVQLPYLFIVCRLIHYLKVIQRDNVGSEKGKQQIEDELNMWLVQYVSDMENPTSEVRARRPLRNAKVQIFEGSTPMEFYHVDLKVTPHFQYMGTSFSLSLQGKL